jgi:2'-5' RNA ligase
LAVVLFVPDPVRTEVDVLRRAFGDTTLARIAPHVTLVPPVNVDADDVPAAIAAVDAAVRGDQPFDVTLGPPETFLPVTPVLYLHVGGDDARAELGGQRARAFVAPLARPVGRDFVPHVTLGRAKHAPYRIDAGITAFGEYEATFVADRLTLLELLHPPGAPDIWTPIHEAPFGGPTVVARGPLQVELSVTSVVPDDAIDLLLAAFGPTGEVLGAGGEVVATVEVERRPRRDAPTGQQVVTARRDGEALGVALGRIDPLGGASIIDAVAVDEPHRRQGVAAHLLRHFPPHLGGGGPDPRPAVST